MTSSKLMHFKFIYIIGILLVIVLIVLGQIAREKSIIADDVEEILFSVESGFYEAEFDLVISSTGGTIYYTLDGSTPTCNSIKYDKPIHISDASQNENVYSMITDVSTGFNKEMVDEYSINLEDPEYITPQYNIDKCSIVRAVIHYGGERYSKVKTASYFVGFDEKEGYEGLNTISIVTDPDNLFGYENGIYVSGKTFDEYVESSNEEFPMATYWCWWKSNYSLKGREYERNASIQFYNKEQKLILSQAGGIRIHGGSSRGYNPKSLNLYAREEYNGKDYFLYNFFGNEYFPSTITLYQGGEDLNSKLRDYLVNKLASNLNVSTMDFEPYALFLDGEYWGVYWLTEKYDKDYIHYHYGVDTDNVIMIKNSIVAEGEDTDLAPYITMVEYCSTADMTIDENYSKACELVDIDSFIDYYATMIYISRFGDWPKGNFALWRSKKIGNGEYNDGRWRWMIFDVYSQSIDEAIIELDSIETTLDRSPMFANLMQNENFRNKFLNRLLEISETVFSANNVEKEIDKYRDLMDIPMRENIKRFYGDEAYHKYADEIESITLFFKKREAWIPVIAEKYR